MSIMDILELADRIFSPSETKVTFKGHQITVQLSLTTIKLYIDGELKESTKTFLSPDKNVALMRSVINEDGRTHIIEVYGKSSFRQAKIKICADDLKIAGQDF